MATYLGRIQLLAKVGSDWAVNDAVLLNGEIGAANVGSMTPVLKMGDGVRPWSQLPNLLAPVQVANDYVAGPTTTLPPGSSATVVIDNLTDPPTISIGVPTGATGLTGPANALTIGTVVTGAPGDPADASITGTPPNQVLSLTLPQGEQGEASTVPGPPNSLTIGTVITGAPGAPADAQITGTPPNQVLSLSIPRGTAGPANALSIGTVTTLSPGTPATATITGTPPTQVLSLGIPQGAPGTSGGGGVPGGATTQVQYNSAGAFAGSADFTYNGTTIVTLGGSGFGQLRGANGPNPGLLISGGSNAGGGGGFAQLLGGAAGLAGYDGGSITVQGGNGLTGGFGGSVTMRGGTSPSGLGGNVTLIGGNSPSGSGGEIFLHTGATTSVERLRVLANGAWSIGTGGAATGTSGQVLTSTGATTPPTWQAAAINLAANYAWTGQHTWTQNLITSAGVYARGGTIGLSTADRVALSDLNDGYLRLNNASSYANGVYAPTTIYAGTYLKSVTGVGSHDLSKYMAWGPINTYGSCYVTGTGSGYHGIGVYDGGLNMVLMSNNSAAGIYVHGDGKWLLHRSTTAVAVSSYSVEAAGFNVTSSRKFKRETGAPTRVAEILSRLRPILYRFRAGDTSEQLGLIAEEVHAVCPHLSNGKTVSYDRLALLLLAEWQAARGITHEQEIAA